MSVLVVTVEVEVSHRAGLGEEGIWMGDMNLEAILYEINHGIGGGGWNRVRNDDRAEWFGQFMTELVVATGAREIEHIDSNVEWGEDGAFSAGVVIFTERTVVAGTAIGRGSGESGVATNVVTHARSGLKTITVSGGASAFGRHTFDPWPGNFQIIAEWKHGLKVRLPMASIQFDEQRQGFTAIYEKLLSEIGG